MTLGSENPQGRVVERFTLPAATCSPSHARERLAPLLDNVGVQGDLADVALLLTSELVTNAIVHGQGDPTIEVRTSDRQIWVGVHDPDKHLPHIQPADSDALGGRGLLLVDALADAWATVPIAGDGKTVWFALSRQPA